MFFNDIPIPTHPWTSDDKIAFHLGSLSISWYGIFVTIGFILAIILVVIKLATWYKIKTDPFYWFCLMAIPVAILGARFWSCCIGDLEWFNFWNFSTGGLAIEGGVVFTLLLGLWWFPFILKYPKYQVRDQLTDPQHPMVRQVSTWVYIDVILPCILIGQVVGRWGNYFNQELYGSIVNSSSFMEWLCHHLPYMYHQKANVYYQPLFLYESCTNLVGFLTLYVGFEFIPKLKAGTIGLCYGVWYGIVRMIMEPLRYSRFSFVLTYVMTALWIVICVTLIILNQCKVITKTRKYACKLIMWDTLTYKIKNRYYQSKIKNTNKKLNQNKPDQQKYQERLVKYQQKANLTSEVHKKNQTLYIRDDHHLLYYYGR